jgi:hypothetical protein
MMKNVFHTPNVPHPVPVYAPLGFVSFDHKKTGFQAIPLSFAKLV